MEKARNKRGKMPSGSPDPPEDPVNPSNMFALSRMVTARHRLHGNIIHSLSRFRSSRSIWCSFPPTTSPGGAERRAPYQMVVSETWCPDSAEESLIFLSFQRGSDQLSRSETRTSSMIPANGTARAAVRERSSDELELQLDTLGSSLQINQSDVR